jgi:hypothetical protein
VITVKRLPALGLWVDFDICVSGNPIEDDPDSRIHSAVDYTEKEEITME